MQSVELISHFLAEGWQAFQWHHSLSLARQTPLRVPELQNRGRTRRYARTGTPPAQQFPSQYCIQFVYRFHLEKHNKTISEEQQNHKKIENIQKEEN